MYEGEEEHPTTYPPGFEPPRDVNVPWYAWLLWPVAILSALALASFFTRFFVTWLS